MILIFSYGKGRSHYTVHTTRNRKSVWHANIYPNHTYKLSLGHRWQKICKCKWRPYKWLELRVSEQIQKNYTIEKAQLQTILWRRLYQRIFGEDLLLLLPPLQRLTLRIAQLLLRLLSVRHFRRMVQNPYCRYKTILRGARQTLWVISWWNLRILFFWARHTSFTFLWQEVLEDIRVENLTQHHSLFEKLTPFIKEGLWGFLFCDLSHF